MATKTAAAAPVPDPPALEAAHLHVQGMFDCDQRQVFIRQTRSLRHQHKKSQCSISKGGSQCCALVASSEQPHWRPSIESDSSFTTINQTAINATSPLAFVTRPLCLLRPPLHHSNSNDNDESVNPGNNLFVNGLATKTENSDLEDLFGKYGKVCPSPTQPQTITIQDNIWDKDRFSTDGILSFYGCAMCHMWRHRSHHATHPISDS